MFFNLPKSRATGQGPLSGKCMRATIRSNPNGLTWLFCSVCNSFVWCRYRLLLLSARIRPGTSGELAHALGQISSNPSEAPRATSAPKLKKSADSGSDRTLRTRTPVNRPLVQSPPRKRASTKKTPAKNSGVCAF